jgi:cellulose synthase/poly-beta-1,6-N-acetylglucosamine synthase-like glycosyltransferase
MRTFLLGYAVFALYSVLAVYAFYAAILLLSHKRIIDILKSSRYTRYRELSGSDQVPPVSILVPSYNEELTIIESVRSLLNLGYPSYEVIVINDGSKDATLQVLIDEFGLLPKEYVPAEGELEAMPIRGLYHNPRFPKLYVVDKENGGKADALNVGINVAHYPLVATIDADSLLEKDALIRLASVYMENPEETIAIGGNVRVANGCKIENGRVTEVSLPRKLLPMFQNIEYLKSFLAGRIGWSAINGLLIVSGAFGLFRRDYLIKVGGYRDGFPGEDMNIIIKLHKYMLDNGLPYRIAYCPDAVCWTQAPESLRILQSQRKRWSRGNIKNIFKYSSMMFVPKYKAVGLLSMPYTLIYETLGPYLRLTGYAALVGCFLLGTVDYRMMLLILGISLMAEILFSCGALLIEEMAFRRYPKFSDLVKMMFYSVLMTLGYNQINVYWKILGHIDYIRNDDSWGVMVRTSWQDDASGAPVSAASGTPHAGGRTIADNRTI